MPHSDGQTGTPVTLVVSPGQAVPPTAPPHHDPIPFTGFELVPFLALAAVLVAAGAVLTALRRPLHAR
jgi:hypothetical protein